MLTDSLGSRASMLLEVENGLHNIAEVSRYIVEILLYWDN